MNVTLLYNKRGIVYDKLGKYQLAIEDYSEAIRLKPNYAEAYYNRAAVYFIQGKDNLGKSDVLKACALGNYKLLGHVGGVGGSCFITLINLNKY